MSKKKPAQKAGRSSNSNGAALMQQFGIDLTIPNFDDPNIDLDLDDGDLESELYKLGGMSSAPKRKSQASEQKKKGPPKQDFASFQKDVDKLLNDMDKPMNENDLSDVDENELMAELDALGDDEEPPQLTKQTSTNSSVQVALNSLISQLEERRKMYAEAVAKAKEASQGTKARRHERQLKLIEEHIQAVRSGQMTNAEKVMAEVNASAPSLLAVSKIDPVEPSQNSTEDNHTTADISLGQEVQAKTNSLQESREQQSSLRSTTSGEASTSNVGASKSELIISDSSKNNSTNQSSAAIDAQPTRAPIPTTVQQALQQRLEELKRIRQVASEKGELARVRRFERQIKQYQEAINANRRNEPFDYTELPDLPGFGPIPGVKKAPPSAELVALSDETGSVIDDISPENQSYSLSQQTRQTVGEQKKAPLRPTSSSSSMQAKRPEKSSLVNPASMPIFPQKNEKMGNAGKSIDALRDQCEQAFNLARENMDRGNKQAAVYYFREYQALKSQIPAEYITTKSESSSKMNHLISSGYEIVPDETVIGDPPTNNPQQLISRLQDDILRQRQQCARNEQLFRKMSGEINAKYAAEYKALEKRSLQDLEKLKQIMQQKHRIPIFHYEKRQLTYFVVNDDLTDDQAEVTVIRALNINVPSGYAASSLETYVVIEFPEATSPAQTVQTRRGTGADNVEYPSSIHKFTIKLMDRAFIRAIKRKEVKFSIFYKAGFLRSDRLIGTTSVALTKLLTTSTIHESLDISTDSHRKKAEGKLEVKIRIREACGPGKQTEVSTENWLFIDGIGESRISNVKSPSVIGEATDSTLSILPALLSPANILNNLLIAHTQNDLNSARSSPKLVHEPVLAPTTQASVTNNLPSSLKILASRKKNIEACMNKFGDNLSGETRAQLVEDKKNIEKEEKRIMDDFIERGEVAAEEYLKNLDILLKHYEQELRVSEETGDKKKSEPIKERIKILTEELHALNPKQDVPTTTDAEVVENPDIF